MQWPKISIDWPNKPVLLVLAFHLSFCYFMQGCTYNLSRMGSIGH